MPEPRLEPGSDIWRATLLRHLQSEPEEAVASLSALVRAQPTRADALVSLALAFTRTGRAGAAAEALRRARFLETDLAALFPGHPPCPTEEQLVDAVGRFIGTSSSPDPLSAHFPVPAGRKSDSDLDFDPQEPGEPCAADWSESTLQRSPSDLRLDRLPDGWIVAQRSLDLWIRQVARWASPLALVNLAAALTHPGPTTLAQALPWAVAMAIGAPITLKAMACEWGRQAPGFASWPRLGVGQLWAAILLLATAFAGLTPSSVVAWFGGADSVAIGLLIWLPLLGLLAPALMTLITCDGAACDRPPLLSLAVQRGLLHAGLLSVVGSLGALILVSLGWAVFGLLNVEDEAARRVMFGVAASVPQSLVLALVAGCGMEALAGRRMQGVFAYES